MKSYSFLLLGLIIILSCSGDDDQKSNPENLSYEFDFTTGTEGWLGDFADYPAAEHEFYELEFGHAFLPEPLDNLEGALKLSRHNHSDDLFMFVKKEITGLIPNREYNLNFNIQIASDVANGSIGIGGSPGESVYIKAGATPYDPQKTIDEMGWYRVNIDKGDQAQSGEDMIVLGNFANGTEENEYTLKTLSNSSPLRVKAGNEGRLWLLIGTDSGFEGKTTIYINKINVN